MSILRELVVNIDFKGMDVNRLERIDNAVDEIERSLHSMDGEIDEATRDFARMGIVGGRSLNHIEREAHQATRALDRLNASGDKFNIPGLNIGGLFSFGPLLAAGLITAIPVAASLVAATGGLAAGFTAAGISAAGFGAIAIPIIKKVTDAESEAVKIQDKIKKADTAEERIKAQKELAALYKDMSQEQRNAMKDFRKFKSYWDDFTKDFEKPIFKAFGDGLRTVENLMTKLQPTIMKTADVVDDLINSFNKNLDSPDMKAFFDWLATDGANYVKTFSEAGGNFFAGFLDLMKEFGVEVGPDVSKWILDVSNKFRDWASNLENNKQFQSFIDYAKENGPIVLDTLHNLWDVGVLLTTSFADMGTTALKALRDISDFLAHDPLVGTLMKVAGAIGSFVKDRFTWYEGLHQQPQSFSDMITPGGKPNELHDNPGDAFGFGYPEADGLSYVPRDGYHIRAHEGERLLTAQQNKLYTAGLWGKGNSNSTTFAPQVTVHVSGGGKDTGAEVADAVRKEMNKFWLQMSLKQA